MRNMKTYLTGLFIAVFLYPIQLAMAQLSTQSCVEENRFLIINSMRQLGIAPASNLPYKINQITDDQQKALKKQLDNIFKTECNNSGNNIEEPEISSLSVMGQDGKMKTVPAKTYSSDKILKSFLKNEMEHSTDVSSTEGFEDLIMNSSVPISFQDSLADFFTPVYKVSNYESDQFATFKDNSELEIKDLYGQNPLSYYRVHPMGFLEHNGHQYGYIKIDYLTLWNHDSGLYFSQACNNNLGFLYYYYLYYPQYFGWVGPIIETLASVLSPHDFDAERSAILVRAQTTDSFVYSENIYDYYVYSVYTAAHEGSISDHSVMTLPAPIQDHAVFNLAYSKHGTYNGNPEGLPLTPDWIIDASYSSIQALYAADVISYSLYIDFLLTLDNVFYGCIVEHFGVGGVEGFANPRINVGEPVPGEILNGCGFILHPKVLEKLQSPIWDYEFIQPAPVPTSLTVTPGFLVLPGYVTFHIDLPNISFEIEYNINSNGPYYTTMTADINGNFLSYFNENSPVGTYSYTRIRNIEGQQWNNISATLIVEPPAGPTCQESCQTELNQCVDYYEDYCSDICAIPLPPYLTPEECTDACVDSIVEGICLPNYNSCINGCQ